MNPQERKNKSNTFSSFLPCSGSLTSCEGVERAETSCATMGLTLGLSESRWRARLPIRMTMLCRTVSLLAVLGAVAKKFSNTGSNRLTLSCNQNSSFCLHWRLKGHGQGQGEVPVAVHGAKLQEESPFQASLIPTTHLGVSHHHHHHPWCWSTAHKISKNPKVLRDMKKVNIFWASPEILNPYWIHISQAPLILAIKKSLFM